jgi:hypothetical protein
LNQSLVPVRQVLYYLPLEPNPQHILLQLVLA